jgi:hypothetical protein
MDRSRAPRLKTGRASFNPFSPDWVRLVARFPDAVQRAAVHR